MSNYNSAVFQNPKKYVVSDKIVEKLEVEPQEMNRGLTLAFLRVLFKYGICSMGFSYWLKGFVSVQEKLQYYIGRHRIRGILSKLIYTLICLHMAFFVVNFNFSVSYSKLVNWIKRMTHAIFVIKLIVMFICLTHGGRKRSIWINILEQGDVIQEKFETFGIQAPSRLKVKIFGGLICLLSVFLCCLHVLFFSLSKGSQWHEISARSAASTLTLNMWSLDVKSCDPAIVYMLGYLGLLFDIISWNLWYFCDALRLFASLIVWKVFRNINSALGSGRFTIDNLSDVTDLHFKGIKLLNLFNQLLSPITLISTLFNIVFVCFWTNYTLISFEFKLSHIVGVIIIARMIAVFYITADVNTQAYQISTWLENSFSEMDTPPKVDEAKFTLFTSLIYSREAIGFKGLNYFTITPAFNTAIVGLVLTYTVVVNQLVTH